MEGKELKIMGDLNFNFLHENLNRSLKTLCEVYQLTKMINEPTRITDSSKSLIDIILTNTPNGICTSGVLHLGISDHSMIYAIRKIAIPTKTKHKVVTTRNYKHFSASSFRRDLQTIEWDKLEHLDDPNEIWSEWKNGLPL